VCSRYVGFEPFNNKFFQMHLFATD
jgi:hypothetical protein